MPVRNIYAPNLIHIGQGALQGCALLKRINMQVIQTIDSLAMHACFSLQEVLIGTNQVATLSNVSAFQSTPIVKGKGHIYVPDDLVDSYKTATNWSVYANQIRPMSEYVEEVNE